MFQIIMDTMLPSPGFSIPSVGTPLHQPEEDQQILFQAQQQQQSMMKYENPPPLMPMGGMQLPHKQHTYAPSAVGGYATPQNLLQPQTPVIFKILCLISIIFS